MFKNIFFIPFVILIIFWVMLLLHYCYYYKTTLNRVFKCTLIWLTLCMSFISIFMFKNIFFIPFVILIIVWVMLLLHCCYYYKTTLNRVFKCTLIGLTLCMSFISIFIYFYINMFTFFERLIYIVNCFEILLLTILFFGTYACIRWWCHRKYKLDKLLNRSNPTCGVIIVEVGEPVRDPPLSKEARQEWLKYGQKYDHTDHFDPNVRYDISEFLRKPPAEDNFGKTVEEVFKRNIGQPNRLWSAHKSSFKDPFQVTAVQPKVEPTIDTLLKVAQEHTFAESVAENAPNFAYPLILLWIGILLLTFISIYAYINRYVSIYAYINRYVSGLSALSNRDMNTLIFLMLYYLFIFFSMDYLFSHQWISCLVNESFNITTWACAWCSQYLNIFSVKVFITAVTMPIVTGPLLHIIFLVGNLCGDIILFMYRRWKQIFVCISIFYASIFAFTFYIVLLHYYSTPFEFIEELIAGARKFFFINLLIDYMFLTFYFWYFFLLVEVKWIVFLWNTFYFVGLVIFFIAKGCWWFLLFIKKSL